MSEERRQRERTKGLGALTPPCPRLQAKKLQPLPTSQRKPSTGRRPPCKLWNVSKLVGSRGGRRWEECMEQGDDGGKRHGASLAAALWSCTKQVSQRRARVNKRHLTWEVPPCSCFCWLQEQDLGTEKGSLHAQYQVWPIICVPSRGGGVACWLVGAPPGGSQVWWLPVNNRLVTGHLPARALQPATLGLTPQLSPALR